MAADDDYNENDARYDVARLVHVNATRLTRLNEAVENAADGRAFDRASDAYQEAVVDLLSYLGPDADYAEVWDVLPEDARRFGELQGDDEHGGLGDTLAWALAWVCLNDEEAIRQMPWIRSFHEHPRPGPRALRGLGFWSPKG